MTSLSSMCWFKRLIIITCRQACCSLRDVRHTGLHKWIKVKTTIIYVKNILCSVHVKWREWVMLKRRGGKKNSPSLTNLIVIAQCLWCFLGLHMQSISPGNFKRDQFGWIIALQKGFYIDPLIMSITDSDNSELPKFHTSAKYCSQCGCIKKTVWVKWVLQDLLRLAFLCSMHTLYSISRPGAISVLCIILSPLLL